MPNSPDLDQIVARTFVAAAEFHEEVGSTNDLARRYAVDPGRRLPLLVVAGRQTAGRGRGSNRWWTGQGSLAMSLLLEAAPQGGTSGGTPLLGLAAATAVVDTVLPLLPGRAVGLCWPNDVYAAGRKLAGILVEVLSRGRRVVGIGLNTNNRLADAPPELRDRATTLLDLTGQACDATEILVGLLANFEVALGEAETAPERLAERADHCCLQRGETLTLRQGERDITGRCRGLDVDGALLLETPEGLKRFHSGTIVGS